VILVINFTVVFLMSIIFIIYSINKVCATSWKSRSEGVG